ncbi:MAG TPA: Glu-tRNA(Gln) amidotransferase subunit GatE [Thermoplasmata archaeon]|nr:Glu-tRNA(Gln) amidotransferase subunit GatE [Thermoplasmata archaeon]
MKVGLEVHQQLATGKLFCACRGELTEEFSDGFERRLRPSRGEDRAIDAAAAFQASRGRRFRYEPGPTSCLVEMDEEPPHALNAAALDVALAFAALVGARPVDEIAVMRKIVVDGSNTAGFQRTALVAVGGAVEVGGRSIGVQSICLEEDAARKVAEREDEIVYRLDRLGIPLIEVATAPDITSGPEARAVAEEIGALLRATRRVRRGIGTIREDLNVSTPGGRRIEVKGVQELRLVATYVEREEGRQRLLLAVRDELLERGARAPGGAPADLSAVFADLATGPLAAAPGRGAVVLGLPLPGFAGLLGPRPGTDERLGRELADQARAVGLKGLVHSDELPGYGATDRHVAAVRAALGLASADAFVLVGGTDRPRLLRALERVAERAAAALEGVPGETRDPLPDGRTRYSRPLPGRHRMYPETDVPPEPVTAERWARIGRALPERPSETEARLVAAHGLGGEIARQLVYGTDLDRFEALTAQGFPAPLVARVLTQDLPALREREGAAAFEPSLERLAAVLRAAGTGTIGREGVPVVLAALAEGAPDVPAAIQRAGLAGFTAEELRALVERVVHEQAALVRAKGAAAFSPLMGDVMREVRGRRDGREIAEELRRAIAAEIASAGR